MGALASFVLTRKGIVYFLTVAAATFVYARGEISADVYIAIIGGGGAVFQATTAWEDAASKSAGKSTAKMSMTVASEAEPATSETETGGVG